MQKFDVLIVSRSSKPGEGPFLLTLTNLSSSFSQAFRTKKGMVRALLACDVSEFWISNVLQVLHLQNAVELPIVLTRESVQKLQRL